MKDIGYISFEDVCQVRRDLESSIAAVAALTITPEEITNLRKLVGKWQTAVLVMTLTDM